MMQTEKASTMATKETQVLEEYSEQQTMGNLLRETRQKKGLEIEEIAEETRISPANLRAIEQADYEKLPHDPFVRGLVTLYGNALGLDGRQIAERFLTERNGNKKASSYFKRRLAHHNLTPKKLAEPAHISSAAVALVLLLLIVFSFTAFCLFFSWNPFTFITIQNKKVSSQAEEVFHPADPSTRQAASQMPLNLEAYFLKDTGLVLLLDNKQAMLQSYGQGSQVHWEAEKQIRLEFFQPNSAVLRLNGREVPFPQSENSPYIINIPDKR